MGFRSFSSNSLNGSLPSELGNLVKLEQLCVLVLGTPYISKPQFFAWISRLLISVLIFVSLNCRYIDSAGLSGPLPSSLSRLTRMKTLYAYKRCFLDCTILRFHSTQILFFYSSFLFRWASDNDFTGQIPEYIGSWANLTEL